MKKEWLAATHVSREFKGRVKAFAFERGLSVGALIILALTEFMERAQAVKKDGGV